ncbi:Flavin prenyltransferase PAD1 [Paramyrothecium foliicola]|nr:Flavin prenyltransferase PAD1 [Paramyrothecium foliicola]
MSQNCGRSFAAATRRGYPAVSLSHAASKWPQLASASPQCTYSAQFHTRTLYTSSYPSREELRRNPPRQSAVRTPKRPSRIVVGITGATGTVYAIRLLWILRELNIETHLIMSKWALATLKYETPATEAEIRSLASRTYTSKELSAPIASGSFQHDGMMIVPCSAKADATDANPVGSVQGDVRHATSPLLSTSNGRRRQCPNMSNRPQWMILVLDVCRSIQNNHEALLELVSSLQSQLDGLASRVAPLPAPEKPQPDATAASERRHTPTTSSSHSEAPLSASRQPSRGFCGPTSPDYSLNVAQIRLRSGNSRAPGTEPGSMASIDDEVLSENEDEPATSDGPSPARLILPVCNIHLEKLFQIFSLLDLNETTRLLRVYQDVVGELHPFVDIEDLICRCPKWHTIWEQEKDGGNFNIADEEHLVIANLALAIAVRAEACALGDRVAGLVQSSLESIISAKLMSPATSIKDVEAVLLAGLCYYFQDATRSAWRMCGLAGNMLREIGFHRKDVVDHVTKSTETLQETSVLIGSVLILDRQFSATTGLPSQFEISSFDLLPISLNDTPYLKAMLAFILISDKFNEPISSAARGEWYDDEDGCDLMNFQIEQWRKKSVGSFAMDNVASWSSDASSRPPSWAILLNLRAASVRSLLWRPWFFQDSRVEAMKERLGPALDLVSNTMQVLSVLDATSDLYRKQHPFYQHLLSSSSALFFLLIAYIEQNKTVLLPTLPAGFADSVSRNYHIAVSLASKYTRISQASRRLHKRLLEIGNTLASLQMLTAQSPRAVTNHRQVESVPSRATQPPNGTLWQAPTHGQLGGAYTQSTDCPLNMTGSQVFGLPAAPDGDLQMGWAESLMWDWQSGGVEPFGFPGNGL